MPIIRRIKRVNRVAFYILFSVILTLTSSSAHADIPWDNNFDANAEDDRATLGGTMEGVDSTPQNTPGGDGSAYQPPSSEVKPLPEGTPEPPSAILDFTFGYHCEHPVSYESGHLMFPTYVRCDDPPPSDATPSTPPSTRTILRRAAATVRADGAGIHKLPPGVSYTNKHIPTIVNVTNPTQTHTVTLFGREVTVTFTAMRYEWNWGDGTPNTITTSPGLAWEEGIDPNNDPRLIRNHYTPPQGWRSMLDGPYPHEDREITLTTTWSGTATNPFTGETQTINGLVTTDEDDILGWVGGDPDHQRPGHHHRDHRQVPPIPPGHQQHRHLGRKTRPLTRPVRLGTTPEKAGFTSASKG